MEKGLDDRRFDPVAYTLDLYAAAPRRLRFQARTRSEAEAWQKQLRSKLTELVGGFPAERRPLRPITLETRTFPGYRREKIVFDSRPGVSVLAYLLLPEKAQKPAPAMICVPGHGRGVDDIVGIDDRGRRADRQGRLPARLRDPGGRSRHGGRRDRADGLRVPARSDQRAQGPRPTSACQPAAGGALLVGQTMIGWRVWDVMRTLDYIATRPELDSSRVGCMGISGGGTATLFAAALEPRIRAALVSGYLNTFRDSIGSLSHCIDNYVPGILNWAEMHDLAGLIAPRPLFVESGEQGQHLPDSTRASRASTRRGRSTASSAPRIGSSRKCFPASTRSGASAAFRSWRVT